jgi:hypothetical protein
MTAPAAGLSLQISATGSETVRRAMAQVAESASKVAATASRSAAESAARVAEAAAVTQQQYARTVQAAERAAYAEQAARERVARATQATAAQIAQSTSSKYGQMALSAASSFNAITWSGQVTGDAIKNILSQTALVGASVFGAGGPIVAAVAVSAMAISNLFTKSLADARQAREKFERELETLQASRDPRAANQALTTLIKGSRAADDEAHKLGMARLKAEETRIVEFLASNRFQGQAAEAFGLGAQKTRLSEVRAMLALLSKEYKELLPDVIAINVDTQNRLAAEKAISLELAQQAVVAERTARAMKALDPGGASASSNGDPAPTGGAQNPTLPGAKSLATKATDNTIEAFRERQSALSNGIADVIAGGVGAGIAAAITSGNIGNAFSALSQQVLAGLGSIFAEMATRMILSAQLMQSFFNFLTNNPVAAITVAVSMMALASAMGGGRARSPRTGGGFSAAGSVAGGSATESVTRLIFGNNSVATAAGMTPRQANHFTIIGPNDPSAQRAIAEIIRKAEGRGLRTD